MGFYSQPMKGKPDGYGKQVTECGDTIEIFLTVADGIVADATFEMHGCGFTLACARAVTALAHGKALIDVKEATTPEEIDRILGGLPEHNKHCADLASEAMASAVQSAFTTKREPWRKLYGNR